VDDGSTTGNSWEESEVGFEQDEFEVSLKHQCGLLNTELCNLGGI
jgi:hypothetical protein